MANSSDNAINSSLPGVLTRFQYWKMILVLGGINFIDAMVYSIPAPFYPKEAESKGLSKSEYGLVFGSFELTSFIVSPVIGNCIHKCNPRTVYYVGVLIVDTSVSVFGFLDRVNHHVAFLILSFLLRIVESTGSALLFVSSYTIVTNRSPDSVATTFATMELLFGMGFSVGPLVGEALFVLGGFQLPFFTLGGTLFMVGILAYLFVDTDNDDDNLSLKHSTSQHKKGIIVELLKIPVVALQAIGIMVGAMSISFLFAVLEPHLRQFGLPPMATGFMFFAYDEGFLEPNALVSGMWMSCMSLGSFLGPSAAGILSDHFRFRNATYLILVLNLCLIGLTVTHIVNQRRWARPRFTYAPDSSPDEQTPCLAPSPSHLTPAS